MNKKPRKWSINIQFEKPVTEIGFGRLPDGSIQYFANGVPIENEKVEYETIYDREKKKKVIHRLKLDAAQIPDNPDFALRRYDLIYAIDTNTKDANGKVISVTTVILCKLDFTDDGTMNYQYGPLRSLEFWNITDHPENVAWMKVIQFIIQDQTYDPSQKIVFIVDSDLGNLAAYNARSLPIYADFYLPENFQLIYASAEVGTKEFLINHLIALSEDMARSLLARILLNETPDDNLVEVHGEPYTHFRIWYFTGFPEDSEMEAPKS